MNLPLTDAGNANRLHSLLGDDWKIFPRKCKRPPTPFTKKATCCSSGWMNGRNPAWAFWNSTGPWKILTNGWPRAATVFTSAKVFPKPCWPTGKWKHGGKPATVLQGCAWSRHKWWLYKNDYTPQWQWLTNFFQFIIAQFFLRRRFIPALPALSCTFYKKSTGCKTQCSCGVRRIACTSCTFFPVFFYKWPC